MMFASFVEDQPIFELKQQNEQYLVKLTSFKESIYSKADFIKRLNQATGVIWQLMIDESAAQNSDIKSINQQKAEALEKRKKDAINSPVVSKLLSNFSGAEITNVEIEVSE